MKLRMLCTRCGVLAHPDTLVEGSDLLEMAGWLCPLALPGWAYCLWRHALRVKVCAHCGSGELMRESQASAARDPQLAPHPAVGVVANLHTPSRWPRALRAPWVRLRLGALLVLLEAALASTWGLSVTASPGSSVALVALAAVAAGGLAREVVRLARTHTTLGACRAWDVHGRPLHIEIV